MTIKIQIMESMTILLVVLSFSMCLTTGMANALTTSAQSSQQAAPAQSAKVWTDKADYHPGELVTIYGSGFLANSPITLTVTKVKDDTKTTWSTLSDAEGKLTTTYRIDPEGAPLYKIQATDGKNNITATFTDSSGTISVTNLRTGQTNTSGNFINAQVGDNLRISASCSGDGYSVDLDTVPIYTGFHEMISGPYADGSSTGVVTYIIPNIADGSYMIDVFGGIDGFVCAVFVTLSSPHPSSFTVSAPASTTAGSAFSVTVTAKGSSGNTLTGYTGTIQFTSSDSAPGVILPADYTFTTGDSGAHTFTSGFTLLTAGWKSVSVYDTCYTSENGISMITVNPSTLNRFTITGYPTSRTAGQIFGSNNVVVTAYDIYSNVKTDYTGQVYFTSTDSVASLPYVSSAKYTFVLGDNGAHTFSGAGFALDTAGSQTITVTNGIISKTSDSITVRNPIISFATNGMSSDASATVLTIDGLAYTYTQIQTLQFTSWVLGSTHTIAATDPVGVSSTKQYVFSSWTNGNGLTAASGTFTTPSSDTTVAVNYNTQYKVTFDASANVKADSTSRILFAAGSDKTASNLPFSMWVNAGDTLSWGYYTNVASTADSNTRYAFSSTSGLVQYVQSGILTVDSAGTVTGTYIVQVQNTFKVNGLTGSASVSPFASMGGVYSNLWTFTSTDTQITAWTDYGTAVWFPAVSDGSNSLERWADLNGVSYTTPSLTSGGATIAQTYYHQYAVTPYYTASGGGNPTVTNVVYYTSFSGSQTATPTLGSSGGTPIWADPGTAVTYDSPIAGTSGERWQVASGDTTTHTAIASVSAATDAIVQYCHQFLVTFGYTTSDVPSAIINSQSHIVTYKQFGASTYLDTTTVGILVAAGTTTPITSDWADAGQAVTFKSPISISSNEQFKIKYSDYSGPTDTAIGSVDSTHTTATPMYYHQVKINYKAITVNDGSTPMANFGSGPITKYPYINWAECQYPGMVTQTASAGYVWANIGQNILFEANSADSASNQVSANERWYANNPVNYIVTLSMAGTTLPTQEYFHQYAVTFAYTDYDSSAITSGLLIGSYQAFGIVYNINAGSSYGTTSVSNTWVDAGTGSTATFISSAGSSERWALSTSTDNKPITGEGTVTESGYYHQYAVTPYYTVNGGGSPTSANIVHYTSCGSSSTVTPTLGSSGGTPIWADAGSAVIYISPISGAAGEQWKIDNPDSATGLHTVLASVTSSQSITAAYYHQYSFSLDYSIVGGGGYTSAPVIRGTACGQISYVTNTLPFTGWIDAGTTWYMGNLVTTQSTVLDGSTSTQRWATAQATTGTATGALTATYTYYHQVSNTITLGDSHGGSLGTCTYTITGTLFGTSGVTIITLNAANSWSASVWTDYNQPITLPDASTPINSERWQFHNLPSLTLTFTSGGGSLVLNGIHQYCFQLAYSTNPYVDPTYPTAPTLTSTKFGSPYTATLTPSTASYWLDAGTSWDITNPLSPSDSDNRWFSPDTLTGTVSAPVSLATTYYYQVCNTFAVDNLWHSSLRTCSCPITGTQFGVAQTIAVLDSSNNWQATLWTDGSQPVTWPATSTPVGGERWQFGLTDYTMSGFLWGGHTYTVDGLHQFALQFSYSVSDSTNPAAPTLTGRQYGIPFSQPITTTPTTYWLDSGIERGLSQYWTLTHILSSSDSTQQWYSAGTSGTVSSATVINPTYYHQYFITFGYWDTDSSPIPGGTVIGSYTSSGATNSINSAGTFNTVGGSYGTYGATSPVSAWVDAGTETVTYQTATVGSQRWAIWTSPDNRDVDGTNNLLLEYGYYHQIQFNLNYAVNGGGSPIAPTLTYTQFGYSSPPFPISTLTTVPTSYWLDAGSSWSVTNPLEGSTDTGRWISGQTVLGTVSASSPAAAGGTVTFVYNRQYPLNVLSDYGDPIGSGWYNAGATAAFGVTSPDGTVGTRYLTSGYSGDASGTSSSGSINMNSAKTVTFSWITQYQISFAITPSGSGILSPAGVGVWENAGSLALSATRNPGYAFSAWSSPDAIMFDHANVASTTATLSGSGTITATFTQNPTTNFVFSTVGAQTAGTPFTITVTAKDAGGNTTPWYNGTVHFTSNDSLAILPADYTFQTADSGAKTFTITLKTAGSDTVKATETTNSSTTGTSGGITVNHASMSNVAVTPVTASLTAGSAKTYKATASDSYGNTWDVTTQTTWSINNEAGGSWSSNAYTAAKAGNWTITGSYAGKSAATPLTVTPAPLDHFGVTAPPSAAQQTGFSITVTALDAYGNTQTGFAETTALTSSTGSINPAVSGNFISGVWTGTVALSSSGSQTITASSNSKTGTSQAITITAATTPSPTATPTIKPTPSPTPSPTVTPNPTTVIATDTTTQKTYVVTVNGNVTAQQISNMTITPKQGNGTAVAFTLTGESGTTGLCNLTIPKEAIPYGTNPAIYIDGATAENQGYTQDADNYYVWFTAHFSTHQVTMQFANSPEEATALWVYLSSIGAIALVSLLIAALAIRKRKK